MAQQKVHSRVKTKALLRGAEKVFLKARLKANNWDCQKAHETAQQKVHSTVKTKVAEKAFLWARLKANDWG